MDQGSLVEYYNRRAAEYEEIYRRPERQADLAAVESRLIDFCRGQHVLEIGCGTGYWTRRIAPASLSVVGIDLADEALEVARTAWTAPGRVRLRRGDAFRLEDIGGHFTAVISTFLWSHIPRREIPLFLEGLSRRFPGGAPILLVDNRYVEGSSTPISRRDRWGNSWQKRRLADGSEFEILKNFPTAGELAAMTRDRLDGVEIRQVNWFWLLTGHIRPQEAESDDSDTPRSR